MELAQELHRLVDLLETSSHGSVDLQADLRLGKSTSRMDPRTRLHGNSVRLPLDLQVARLRGSSDLEDTVATANTVVAATVVLHHGSSPEVMTEATTTTAAMAAGMVDTVDMEVEEEAMVRVHLPEVLLPGCSRKHMQDTALLAWTITVLPRHLHHRPRAFRLRPLLAICRRPLRHLPSSGCQC